MSAPTGRMKWAHRLLAPVLLGLALLGAPSASADASGASVDFTVHEDAYENTVRVASPAEMRWPILAVDDSPSSPANGTVYVVGAKSIYTYSNVSPQPILECWVLAVADSRDGGRTFGPPHGPSGCGQAGTIPTGIGPGGAAVGNDGALYVVAGKRLLRSGDGGSSWRALTSGAGNGTPIAADAVAVDEVTGIVHAATLTPAQYGWSPMLVRLVSSGDGGITWSLPVTLYTSNDTSPEPITLAAYGGVAVAAFPLWPLNVSDRPIIVAAYSATGGLSVSSLTLSVPGVGMLLAPRLAVSPGGVYALSWSEATRNATSQWGYDFAVFSARSSDGGRNFPEPVRVRGGEDLTSAFTGVPVAIDRRSRVYLSWADNSGTVHVAVSNATSDGFDEASFVTYFEYHDVASGPSHGMALGSGGTVILTWYAERWVLDSQRTSRMDTNASGAFVRTLTGAAEGTVSDPASTLSGLSVRIELREPSGATAIAAASWTGGRVALDELRPAAYDLWLTVGASAFRAGSLPVQLWSQTTFRVRVEGTAPLPLAAIGLGGVVIAGTAVLLAVHYMRVTREGTLQRRVRLLMYEHIRDHPGSSFSAIRDAMGLKNGVAAYHLGVLEKQGFVHSEAQRRRRWYFPNGDVSLWKDLPLSRLQSDILDRVRRSPGVGLRELSRSLDRQASTVAYNLRGLEREGVVRVEHRGRKVHCFPVEPDGAA